MITVYNIFFGVKGFLNQNSVSCWHPSSFSLPSAFVSESYAVRDLHERLTHGRQLKIYLPKNAEKLEFTPAGTTGEGFLFWQRGKLRSEIGWSWREAGSCFQCCCSWCISIWLLSCLLQGDQRQGVWHRQWPTLVHWQGNQSHFLKVCPTGNTINCWNKIVMVL